MQEDNLTKIPRQFGWAFWIWLIAVFVTLLIVVIVSTAAAVSSVLQNEREATTQSRVILTVADFPNIVKKAVTELWSEIVGDPLPQLMDRKAIELPQWVRHFPDSKDTGYLLFSGVDPVARAAVVQMIRISDGMQVARWDMDWPAIFSHTSRMLFSFMRGNPAARAMHPMLLEDGDIIFNTSKSLVRQSACSTKPVWVLDEVMHHSNELDETGSGLWVPSIAHDGYTESPWLQERLRDDSLAHVTTDGVILENRSFARILRNNDMKAMLLGAFGLSLSVDPVHINQIKVAPRDSPYWKRGDLLISARHLSTVFLYRPSTDKIVWYKTGPWMNQHSVDFVDEQSISVLDNNVVSGAPVEHSFMSTSDTNKVYIYSFGTKQVTQPFEQLLQQARPLSITEGRARILPDGGLFFEETNNGRHLRFTKDRLLWSRVNDYDKDRVGLVSWSRYLTAEEASVPLKALASRQCTVASPAR